MKTGADPGFVERGIGKVTAGGGRLIPFWSRFPPLYKACYSSPSVT